MAENKPIELDPDNAGVKEKKMKHETIITIVCCMLSVANATATGQDSINVELSEINVIATRATETTPVTFTDVTKEKLSVVNHGQDIPFLLQSTPSLVATSDAGTGIGYTAIHIRGTDPTRINITANGIPMNDAESGLTYFSNIPDFASSVQDIQIQRGIGTSTNGAGAFGASINMRTDNFSQTPWGALNVSYGMYATNKETVQGGSGMISLCPSKYSDRWFAVEGRLSYIGSNGYIDRASAHMPSFFLQTGIFTERTSLKFITFNGSEETYHAWDYTSKDDWKRYGRSYNPAGLYLDNDGDTAFYHNQTDYYHQQHYQLHFTHRCNSHLSLNASLHYTHGFGYYEQYKRSQYLPDYGIEGTYSDLVRRRNMKNDFYGIIASLYYNRQHIENILGTGWNKYYGSHYGTLLWTRDKDIPLPTSHYYFNNARKYDYNIYDKVTWEFLPTLFAFADIQYRYVSYQLCGLSDTQAQDRHTWHFLNPKFGFTWMATPHHRLYASYAIAHKEPTRNDYEDAVNDPSLPEPTAERLNDLELGWQGTFSFPHSILTTGINIYSMDYDNQFVLTGAQDGNGEFIATNVKDSYRRGIEFSANYEHHTAHSTYHCNVNTTLSRNRASACHLSYSPDFNLNATLGWHYRQWRATMQNLWVGKQYMTNTNNELHILEPYFVSNLHLDYTFPLHSSNITIGTSIYNVFNEEYESNGSAGDGWCVYSCQAPTHILFHLRLTI